MPILLGTFCLLAGVLKMLAATAYIAFAVSLGATDTAYGRLVLGALAFCWLGDLFLTGTGRLFLTGLGAFFLGHVLYSAAFLVRGVDAGAAAVGAVVMVAVGVTVMRWLLQADLEEAYRAPVAAYVVGIGVMVALALGAAWPRLVAGGGLAVIGRALILGAGAFAVSDLLVARQRFVQAESWNRLVGLPLYLAAQLLLASTV